MPFTNGIIGAKLTARRFKFILIRYRLSLTVFSVGVLGMAALFADRVSATREILLARAQMRAQSLAEAAGRLAAPSLWRGDSRSLQEKLAVLVRLPGVVSIQVFNREGKRVSLRQHQAAADPDVSGEVLILAAAEVADPVSHNVIGRVEVSVSKQHLQEKFREQGLGEAALGAMTLIVLAAASWLIGALLGRRLEFLVDAVGRMESGKPLGLADTGGDFEVDQLVRAINGLNERLVSETAQRKKLEAFKDDLTNMLVHDMKHPLTVMTIILSLLEEEQDNRASKEKMASMLRMAKKSIRRGDAMVEDLLQVARLSRPEMRLEKSRLSVADFVNECAGENSLVVEQSQRGWRLEMADDIAGRWIFGDAILLKRCVGNLVLNAIENSPPGSVISLGVRASKRDPSKAEIFVRDQGPGIEAPRREAIFQKYTTFSQSAKNVGLGLAFCKMAAEKHSARLELIDAEEPGTAFALVIPMAAKSAAGVSTALQGG